jgi:hypothetical protein
VHTISPRTYCASSTPGIRAVRRRILGFALILWTEFRRAVAAEQRCEELRHNGTLGSRADIARQIFEEYYSWNVSDEQGVSRASRLR